MRYGLIRNIDIYRLGRDKGETVLSTAGDYIRSQRWCGKHLKGVEEGIADLYQSYVWAWEALKRLGKLDEYELPKELTPTSLDTLTDQISVYLNPVKEDSLPLAPMA